MQITDEREVSWSAVDYGVQTSSQGLGSSWYAVDAGVQTSSQGLGSSWYAVDLDVRSDALCPAFFSWSDGDDDRDWKVTRVRAEQKLDKRS